MPAPPFPGAHANSPMQRSSQSNHPVKPGSAAVLQEDGTLPGSPPKTSIKRLGKSLFGSSGLGSGAPHSSYLASSVIIGQSPNRLMRPCDRSNSVPAHPTPCPYPGSSAGFCRCHSTRMSWQSRKMCTSHETVPFADQSCCCIVRRLWQPRERGQAGAAAHSGQRRHARDQRQRPSRQWQRPPWQRPPRQQQQHQVLLLLQQLRVLCTTPDHLCAVLVAACMPADQRRSYVPAWQPQPS